MCDTLAMADKVEIMQRAIGLLTLAHGATRRGEITEANEQDMRASLELLRQDVFNFSMKIGSIPPDSEAVVRRVADEVGAELTKRAELLLVGFISAFLAVVREYERDCPDANVAAILQKASLDLTHKRSVEEE
jgi:hypothetical protein